MPKRRSKGIYQHPIRTIKRDLRGRGSKKKPRRSRAGPNFFEGDDLRKRTQDRKRSGSKYEDWEKPRKRK